MSKPVVLTHCQWQSIWNCIKQDYPQRQWLLRDRMRQHLGFTVREHEEWVQVTPKEEFKKEHVEIKELLELYPSNEWYWGKEKQHTVRLDFYDESKRTMFLLKYGDKITAK